MENEKLRRYIVNTITLLKNQSIEAKKNADSPKDGFKDYAQGLLMGYYSIISLLKHQAFAFCIDQKELGLADIKPDIDLLGLTENPTIDFAEDNWAIDLINEEKIKGYLSDSIKLLKESALEAKRNADNSTEGSRDYNQGEMMAYHKTLSTMKNQALFFDLRQEDIGLSDIESEQA